MIDRTPRTAETREGTARPKAYAPPSLLPDPTPSEGYTFRWVASKVNGVADDQNAQYRFREGFIPCKAEDHPEFQQFRTEGGNIESGGLMLCKMSNEIAKSRDDYFTGLAGRNNASVDTPLDEIQDSRMPLHKERNSRVSFGR